MKSKNQVMISVEMDAADEVFTILMGDKVAPRESLSRKTQTTSKTLIFKNI